MLKLGMPEKVYVTNGNIVYFNQLAVKIEMDSVSNEDYYLWLDKMSDKIESLVPGSKIAEKENARISPPLNTAIYYDTPDYKILPTGALLRTSCNKITHAFCAFKDSQDDEGVRNDHRYVFSGDEKSTIQLAPASNEAVEIVKRLLCRKDIEHPGTYIQKYHGVDPENLEPAICLEDYRFTFFVWLDKFDALRCSIDRFEVSDLRIPSQNRVKRPISEVELAVYPRIDPERARDPRVIQLIKTLVASLCEQFGVSVTTDIKYQRSAKALEIW